MEYIHCLWIHSFPDEPVVLVSELDNDRNEVRKVEMWRNGDIGWAGENNEADKSELSWYPIPSIEEINSDTQFSAIKITKDDFEKFRNLAKG